MANPDEANDELKNGPGNGGSCGCDEEVGRLRQEVEDLRRKSDENWDLFLRSRADLDNYRKRTQRDIAMMVRMGKKDFLLRLLEIADNFRRALAASGADAATLRSGLDMLSRQLDAVLDGEGVKAIPSVGEKFDPTVHDAVATWVSPDVTDDTVSDEIQRGYTYQGDVLRVARVRVAQPFVGTRPTAGQAAAGAGNEGTSDAGGGACGGNGCSGNARRACGGDCSGDC